MYFELTHVDVLVTEFVTGIWLTEILTALETDNHEALAKLEAMMTRLEREEDLRHGGLALRMHADLVSGLAAGEQRG